jgi:predicted homoserine dehydrogenase-like protein
MHCAKCNVKDLKTVFSLKSQGGILEKEGVVDFAIGDVAPGVFVVFTTDNPTLIEGLSQRDMGYGPNYLLLRPYHLCSCETPITVAQGVLYGESTAHPMKKLTSECITIAKRDLSAGQVPTASASAATAAPLSWPRSRGTATCCRWAGQGRGAHARCQADEVITYDSVGLNNDSVLLQLRRVQDQLYPI